MLHLLCYTCEDHFFSGESGKDYVCPFCHAKLEPNGAALPLDEPDNMSQPLA
ncbi:hypothetical protein [Aneurinibacillus migulanus]|uniref:Uncharacterized protein n=1 Tax=Aneurinibacillus migulanus TaxID=47500 RepID=A0A1G8HR32_ANEMI|nr:hypothetical protein [Aneurinibacillus migulanus]MCP1354441.1 hypothetical protein [Aneurinibacillus migulanus]MED0891537.1 hypothetical protein [Aneurinibacillus migulanus]MED1613774.1 hypothetical protein [Aneurinibacillus migulanus]MED4728948.1 hypothetical protein [Aneurinibacillus migulanus]SDI09108.1 hypothetical protein SAMN04487909_101518 [Aneurinibacillus migulanus]